MTGIDADSVLELYREYAEDLRSARDEMRELWLERGRGWSDLPVLWRLAPFLPGPRMRTMLDDESAEIAYLLVRASRPDKVIEISPCDGWSTRWILRALSDNDKPAALTSYDLHDGARENVGSIPPMVTWNLCVGDVKTAALPDEIDFLYLDSDHSASFAEWYLEEVVRRVLPGSPVCVDDIFHEAEPRAIDGPFGESRIVHDWMVQRGIRYVTASRARAPDFLARIREVKESLGFFQRTRPSTANSTVFFRL